VKIQCLNFYFYFLNFFTVQPKRTRQLGSRLNAWRPLSLYFPESNSLPTHRQLIGKSSASHRHVIGKSSATHRQLIGNSSVFADELPMRWLT
jgi:hypothetical protein